MSKNAMCQKSQSKSLAIDSKILDCFSFQIDTCMFKGKVSFHVILFQKSVLPSLGKSIRQNVSRIEIDIIRKVNIENRIFVYRVR